MGRPSKAPEWLTEDGLAIIAGWARQGLTNEQIAHNIGISRETLNEWRKQFPAFSDSLKQNKDIADTVVENALYKAAIEGNTTAMIFWLKNRKREKWADKPAPMVVVQGLEKDPLSSAFEELENE